MAKQALGKGLGALIKKPSKPGTANNVSANGVVSAQEEVQPGERVEKVAIGRVVPSPFQPRKVFRDDQLEELKESISQHGVIQPLIVREVDGKLELIAGERRWRASQALGLSEVPVVRREASDRDVLEMALIENLQREDLDAIEEARAFQRLAEEFSLRQEDIAKRVGKNRATVANAIRLLDLAPELQTQVSQRMLNTGHAKVLLGVKDLEAQVLLGHEVIRRKLSVRATERLVAEFQRSKSGDDAKPKAGRSCEDQLPPQYRQIANNLRERFATHVSLNHSAKKGKIEIEYYGEDDLSRILDLLGMGNEEL
ncbi:ParB/RepB/Spo0J family partition protein [Sulfuriroseicoccus oceanibius]|uniref:ParB/RepB/Spo0J family partition protein n=1 Tax=Sulfuriroseicoccus oceanibius TaxID=2707525 RepID=A0A6B3L1D5_9BACT|nr:ParB/RepB/Spo0J family partition protein [Sulfuriroseicoccus oceanibius]QQL43849.1 ParB/RepB/Spo0J family partition protein [Sulfuriroseicoccus oceanibius]